MTLELHNSTVPPGLRVKTFGAPVDGNVVHLGTYELSLVDFLEAARYVLTNTDLEEDDPRREFVEEVKAAVEVGGFDVGRNRLQL